MMSRKEYEESLHEWARLIAAAPELLHILSRLVLLQQEHSKDRQDPTFHLKFAGEVAVAQSIIAKAEGK